MSRMRPWLAMAVLVVLSLGATVFVAQRALTEASDIVVRGEGDVLLGAVAADLGDLGASPTNDDLARIRADHEASGLRYVAVVDPGGGVVSEAGSAAVHEPLRPGQASVVDGRVRVAGPLFPPHRHGADGEPHARHAPRPLVVVVELEPPVIAKLRGDLTRVSVVAAVAGAILLAFTIAWSRSAARLAAVEEKRAREERLVALGSMSSVMAHELRNPLASLKGHAQLLAEDLDDEGDEKKKAKAERVVHEAERLERLTTSLLDFVRDGPIERASLSPRELVDHATEHLAVDRVAIDVERAPREIFVDDARLARALHNVVENALLAGDGAVEVRVAAEEPEVVIEVRDHGPGIPAGAEAQIFEPFHTTRTRGTGLGLAVARRIAEQHGGTLTGANHPDGGALFRLRFTNRR